MSIIAVALPVIALAVMTVLLVDIREYRAGRSLLSGRRLALRLAAGLLTLGLLVAIFVGLFVLRLRDAAGRPALFLVYWSGCLAAALALMAVMLADMREVGNRFTQRQHEIWRDMARFVAGAMRSGGSDEESGTKGDSRK